MSLPEPTKVHQIQGHDITLSVLELGPAQAPCVVMLHGLRDSAWSLLPVASELSKGQHGYRVLLPDLRGHGKSDLSQAYAMPNFLLDLLATIDTFSSSPVALFGHSLGGQIATRFSALFAEKVKALIVAEGMGPPKRPHEDDPVMALQSYRASMLNRLKLQRGGGRALTDIEDGANRLLRNNPRLNPDQAREMVIHLTTSIGDELHWNFDPRASSVFIDVNTPDNRKYWQQIEAQTCIISGTLSYEYWGQELAQDGFTGHFSEGEMEARAAFIPNHEHHWFDHSGHMVHYDEPTRLGEVSRKFLEQHYG